MPDPIRVLFLCVHNSARSQMAEAFLRRHGGDRFEAHSAGSQPAAAVSPLAVRALAQHGLDASGLRPKHQDTFAGQQWHYVITTCDAAVEACPVFPGAPTRVQWRFDDPSAVVGSEERGRAYARVAREIDTRVRLFVNAVARERPAAGGASWVEEAVRAVVDRLDDAPARP